MTNAHFLATQNKMKANSLQTFKGIHPITLAKTGFGLLFVRTHIRQNKYLFFTLPPITLTTGNKWRKILPSTSTPNYGGNTAISHR